MLNAVKEYLDKEAPTQDDINTLVVDLEPMLCTMESIEEIRASLTPLICSGVHHPKFITHTQPLLHNEHYLNLVKTIRTNFKEVK